MGGAGASFLDHTIAYEALGQGCPSTALSFNMHASVVMPVLQSTDVMLEPSSYVADLVVHQHKLIGGNFSEPGTTSLIGERSLQRAGASGGWRIQHHRAQDVRLDAGGGGLRHRHGLSGRRDGPVRRHAAAGPADAAGRRVNANWDTLGMRATRSDSLILEDCRVPDSAVLFRSDDIRPFRLAYLNWFWGSYTAVYLGVAVAAYDELRRAMHARQPTGHAQSLAYHPDVRRHVAEIERRSGSGAADHLSFRLAAATRKGRRRKPPRRCIARNTWSARRSSRITRVALTLGGAHGIFKGSRLEQLFRDGAIAPIQPPPADFCLWHMGLHELGIEGADVLPPIR